MFGFATNETPTLMPTPIYYAHKLSPPPDLRAQGRHSRLPAAPTARPRSASSSTTASPVRIDNVVVSSQHDENVAYSDLKEAILKEVIMHTLPEELIDDKLKTYINPTGRFVIGGPRGRLRPDRAQDHQRHLRRSRCPTAAARSLRQGPVQGRPFRRLHGPLRGQERRGRRSGPTNAKSRSPNAIGVRPSPCPWSFPAPGHRPGLRRAADQGRHRGLRPAPPTTVLERLNLRRPIFQKTTNYGHFGRELPEFNWERTDAVDDLRTAPAKSSTAHHADKQAAPRFGGGRFFYAGRVKGCLLAYFRVTTKSVGIRAKRDRWVFANRGLELFSSDADVQALAAQMGGEFFRPA